MAARDQRPIVVTRPDLQRLRLLIETARQRRRWEEVHLLALAEELEDAQVVEPEMHQPEAAARPRRVVES